MSLSPALNNKVPFSFQHLTYPRSSKAFTHSDYIHFGSYPPEDMMAVWVALEDIHPDSGPLFYYDGSHKLPYIHMQDLHLKTVHTGDYPTYQGHIDSLCRRMGMQKKYFIPKKGEALIWSANLIHGGPAPINRHLTRHSLVFHYHFYESEYVCFWFSFFFLMVFLCLPGTRGGQSLPTSMQTQLATSETLPHTRSGGAFLYLQARELVQNQVKVTATTSPIHLVGRVPSHWE
jgi:hypothetical protein